MLHCFHLCMMYSIHILSCHCNVFLTSFTKVDSASCILDLQVYFLFYFILFFCLLRPDGHLSFLTESLNKSKIRGRVLFTEEITTTDIILILFWMHSTHFFISFCSYMSFCGNLGNQDQSMWSDQGNFWLYVVVQIHTLRSLN